MRFNFTILHVPGKQLVIADTLSRAPVNTPTEADEHFISETNVHAQSKDLRKSEVIKHKMKLVS